MRKKISSIKLFLFVSILIIFMQLISFSQDQCPPDETGCTDWNIGLGYYIYPTGECFIYSGPTEGEQLADGRCYLLVNFDWRICNGAVEVRYTTV